MKDKKNILRVGTFLAILMFLLIPLLSSHVAATISFEPGSMSTLADGTKVDASGSQAANSWAYDDGSGSVSFECDIIFEDTGSTGGSSHYAIMQVWKTSNPSNVLSDSESKQLSSGQSFERTLTVQDTYSQQELPCKWKIDLYCQVIDTAVTPSRDTWTVNPLVEFEVKANP